MIKKIYENPESEMIFVKYEENIMSPGVPGAPSKDETYQDLNEGEDY